MEFKVRFILWRIEVDVFRCLTESSRRKIDFKVRFNKETSCRGIAVK